MADAPRPVITGHKVTGWKGSKAGESFESEDAAKAKRKADAYRVKHRKSFAWKPPTKAGVDVTWDTFDPDKDESPKLSDMDKKK